MNKKVTPSTFKACKILLNSGETQREIASYMGVSQWVVCRINKAESFEEYLNICSAERKKKIKEPKKVEETPSEPPKDISQKAATIQVPYYISQKLDAITEQLKLISNKLAYIVEELTD